MGRYFLSVFLSVLFFLSVNAQQIVDIRYDGTTGVPSFVKFDGQTTVKGSKSSFIKSILKVPAGVDYKLQRTEKDPVIGQLERYQQYYKGIKVEHGRYFLHLSGQAIVSMNGSYIDVEGIDVKPSISEKEALKSALKKIGAKKYMWEDPQAEQFAKQTESNGTYLPKGELVIIRNYDPSDRQSYMKPVLAYKFNIYAKEPLSRDYVYVDAHTGKVVYIDPIIKHVRGHEHSMATSTSVPKVTSVNQTKSTGNAETRYSGTRQIETEYYNGQYRLHDLTRGNGIFTYNMNQGTNYSSATDFYDNDNSWTAAEYHNSAKDDAALDAHWGAEMVYDYWKNVHGRQSFDNNNGAIKSYVHYDVNYDNAYWNGSVMTYGDGSGTYFDALTSLDVCAHEIGHAVCSYTADLTYSNESGALNEALSDIWGACVEYYAAPDKQTWIMGEDIDRRTSEAYPGLRDMSNPKAKGQPDTYGGENWYTGTADNGGVHTNSGVMNYIFYLMAQGGSGTNDLGNSYNVTGIGIDKASKIIYRAEAVYATNSTNYAQFRDYCIQAATDLYGAGSQEVITTTNAFYAGGVGAAYGQVSYCSSKGNSSYYEWIASVQIGSFSNTSGAAGYTDFTSKTVNLTAGQSYSVTLTPGFRSSSYTEYWRIWIDFNRDGDFDDPGELVLDPGGSSSAINATMTIPSSAQEVTTRMRVSMKYNAAPTSCETFSYGEVEDYTVVISAGSGVDTQAPTAPSNLTASNVTQTTVDLSWTASTDNVGVTGYDVYQNNSLVKTVTTTSTQITGLSPATTYSFYVKAKDAAGNVSAASNTVTVTTQSDNTGGGMPSGYCSSKGNNANYEWIDYVGIGSISNATGSNGGYADFTNLSTNLNRGGSYDLTISAGFASYSYTEYWTIYIDWNRDGDFYDSGEEVAKGYSSSSGNLVATITVPSDASLGTTRMRVSMKYNSYQTPCETFSYGEVEDYALVIGTGLTFTNNTGAQGERLKDNGQMTMYDIYPVPFDNVLNVYVPQVGENMTYQIVDVMGKVVKSGKISSSVQRINAADLPNGVYLIRINDGQKIITHKAIKR